jgi:hypothetical protein
MLLNMCEFCENRPREGRIFLVGISGITFILYACTVKRHYIFKVKNAEYYVADYTICNLVMFSLLYDVSLLSVRCKAF